MTKAGDDTNTYEYYRSDSMHRSCDLILLTNFVSAIIRWRVVALRSVRCGLPSAVNERVRAQKPFGIAT